MALGAVTYFGHFCYFRFCDKKGNGKAEAFCSGQN